MVVGKYLIFARKGIVAVWEDKNFKSKCEDILLSLYLASFINSTIAIYRAILCRES